MAFLYDYDLGVCKTLCLEFASGGRKAHSASEAFTSQAVVGFTRWKLEHKSRGDGPGCLTRHWKEEVGGHTTSKPTLEFLWEPHRDDAVTFRACQCIFLDRIRGQMTWLEILSGPIVLEK